MLGEIPVAVRLAIGSERLRLFVTDSRIIVAHIGKRGTAAVATTSVFGRLSGAVESLFKGGKESVTKRNLGRLTPQQIIDSDKDNFFVGYEEIVRVDVERAAPFLFLTLVTLQDKLEFSTTQSPEQFLELLRKNLGSKLNVEKL